MHTGNQEQGGGKTVWRQAEENKGALHTTVSKEKNRSFMTLEKAAKMLFLEKNSFTPSTVWFCVAAYTLLESAAHWSCIFNLYAKHLHVPPQKQQRGMCSGSSRVCFCIQSSFIRFPRAWGNFLTALPVALRAVRHTAGWLVHLEQLSVQGHQDFTFRMLHSQRYLRDS